MGRLKDKVMVITGGTAGIGLAIAKCARKEGAVVIVTGRDEKRGTAAATELGGDGHYLPQDVTDERRWKEIFDRVLDDFGRVDVLVNNAGVVGSGAPQDPEHMSLEEWHTVTSINFDSVFLGCRASIAAMSKEGGGSIINISSTAGILATPAIAAYGAAKAGVRHLTKSVAIYCARRGNGIRCNSIHPAMIDTTMSDSIFRLYDEDPAAARAAYLQRVPLGFIGEADDVAHAVTYLASDESRYVTGIELTVAGGLGV